MWHVALLLAIATLASCHDTPEYADNPKGNFEALWAALDEHYCFFEHKNVDWQAIGEQYRQKIADGMTDEELFRVCADMLAELKDGHTNLSSPFDVSRYWIWEQYPQNYDERLIQEHYFNFDYHRASGIDYGILSNNVAYMHYASFSSTIGEGNLDYILSSLASASGLIVDVRDNSGGNSGNADYVLRHLTADSIRTDSWSSPTYIPALASWGRKAPQYHSPSSLMPPIAGTTPYLRPVAVLVDRGTFSAAEDFCAVFRGMKRGPLVGTPTGGSTGNGVRVTLIPGHAYANICAKHDVAPDGTEFVGTGLHPTVEVRETYASLFRDKTDAALTEALRLLAVDATPQPAPAKPR